MAGGVVVAAVAALAVTAALRGGSSGGASAVSVRGPAAGGVGDQAPAFSAPTVSGDGFASSSGKPTLLYFMAGWCGTCVPEAKALGAVAPAVTGQADLVAVDVDPSDSWSSLRRFVSAVGAPDYVFAKDDGTIGRAFAVNSLDVTIGIDASGRIAYRHLGGLDEAGVRAALAQTGVRA